MADAEDTKPAGGDGETITIRVRDQTGEEVRARRRQPPARDAHAPALLGRAQRTARTPRSPRNFEMTGRVLFRPHVRAQTFFKVKKTTRMEKVFNTYAQRKGVNQNSLRFLLDGERINADSTPKSLDLEDQDQIDCMLEQRACPKPSAPNVSSRSISRTARAPSAEGGSP